MGYVKANTAPVFGSRFQAISPLASRLGAYMRASFPLPTTSMSKPLAPRQIVTTRLGLGNPSPGGIFWDGPYPSYGQPELSATRVTALGGEWVPPSAPGPLPFDQGAVSYRIDPVTGQYKFSSTDIMPRGVWKQNTFQHPVKPALSALGVPIGGCACGGRCKCKGLGRLGAPGDACTLNTDCDAGLTCDQSTFTCKQTASGPPFMTPSGPVYPTPVPGVSNSQLQQVANAINSVFNPPAPAPRPPASSSSGFLTGVTNIAGLLIPNPILIGGVALLALGMGGRRR